MQIKIIKLTVSLIAALLLQSVWAANPSSGTLSTTSGPVTYEAGPFLVSNPTVLGTGEPICEPNPEGQVCDNFALTVDLPADFQQTNPDALIRVEINWENAAADFDLFLLDETGNQIASAATSANPEIIVVPAGAGSFQRAVQVEPFLVTGDTFSGRIELIPEASTGGGSDGGDGGDPEPVVAFGQPTPTAPGRPRYQNFFAPDGSAAQGGQGEANIGFNPHTGNIMLMNLEPVFRLTPPELRNPPLPEAGPALWENVSPITASATTVDPILVTDQDTGRTFISNQFFGANILFAFSDDDGETWIEASASPPHGGIDHQTIGVGPYPEPLAGQNPIYPNAVYYCSQALLPDFCQRSDDGGLSFGPGIPVNTGLGGCGGLHGHIKVAPNGTVYLPDESCGGGQGASISDDAGVTWRGSVITDSGSGNGSDPSIALASDNTAYFCYTNDTGAWVAVSHDNGLTWEESVNISARAGVKNAVFPQAVAGDPDRAACGFIGTDVPGNFQGLDFPGKWFLFIAHTYDGGQTWTTVNATPNDPVQGAGGVCTGGLGCGSNRNLLDFNEVTMDDRGRVLFGYDDGCVSETCLQTGGETNDFVAHWRVARQIGGKPLLAEFDPVEPAAPGAPFLEGERTAAQTTLTWRAPNNGGSDITEYRILRGESSIAKQQIATVPGGKTRFVDFDVDSVTPELFYQVVAVNAEGQGPASNEVVLEVSELVAETSCMAPGITLATDGAGDCTADACTQDTDLVRISVAEPPALEGNFVITEEVVGFTVGQPPPDSFYPVLFPKTATDSTYIALDVTQGTPRFTFGTVTDVSAGVLVFSEQGTLDERSTFTADGDIIYVVPKNLLGDPQPGEGITGFDGRTRVGFSSVPSRDTIGPAAYTVRGTAACEENNPPLAVLSAEPTSGTPPLVVDFDAGASFDQDGDSIDEFRFDFGDGTAPVSQSSPMVSHAYENAGNFKATLTVTDARGEASQNAASVVIVVEEAARDVTEQIRLRANNASFANGMVRYDLRLENISSEAIGAPLRSEITQIESQSGQVTAANADNDEPAAGAFWLYDGRLNGDDELGAGEVSQPRNLAFNNPDGESFSVTYRVFTGPVPDAGGSPESDEDLSSATLIRVTVDPLLNLIDIETLNAPEVGLW